MFSFYAWLKKKFLIIRTRGFTSRQEKKVAVQREEKSFSERQLHLHMDTEWSSLMGFAFFKMFSIRRLLNSSQGFSLLLYKISVQKSLPAEFHKKISF